MTFFLFNATSDIQADNTVVFSNLGRCGEEEDGLMKTRRELVFEEVYTS